MSVSENFSLEQKYVWNCLAYNNESENDWGDSNFSITYDIVAPNLTLLENFPGNETSSSATKIFRYDVSDVNWRLLLF